MRMNDGNNHEDIVLNAVEDPEGKPPQHGASDRSAHDRSPTRVFEKRTNHAVESLARGRNSTRTTLLSASSAIACADGYLRGRSKFARTCSQGIADVGAARCSARRRSSSTASSGVTGRATSELHRQSNPTGLPRVEDVPQSEAPATAQNRRHVWPCLKSVRVTLWDKRLRLRQFTTQERDVPSEDRHALGGGRAGQIRSMLRRQRVAIAGRIDVDHPSSRHRAEPFADVTLVQARLRHARAMLVEHSAGAGIPGSRSSNRQAGSRSHTGSATTRLGADPRAPPVPLPGTRRGVATKD